MVDNPKQSRSSSNDSVVTIDEFPVTDSRAMSRNIQWASRRTRSSSVEIIDPPSPKRRKLRHPNDEEPEDIAEGDEEEEAEDEAEQELDEEYEEEAGDEYELQPAEEYEQGAEEEQERELEDEYEQEPEEENDQEQEQELEEEYEQEPEEEYDQEQEPEDEQYAEHEDEQDAGQEEERYAENEDVQYIEQEDEQYAEQEDEHDAEQENEQYAENEDVQYIEQEDEHYVQQEHRFRRISSSSSSFDSVSSIYEPPSTDSDEDDEYEKDDPELDRDLEMRIDYSSLQRQPSVQPIDPPFDRAAQLSHNFDILQADRDNGVYDYEDFDYNPSPRPDSVIMYSPMRMDSPEIVQIDERDRARIEEVLEDDDDDLEYLDATPVYSSRKGRPRRRVPRISSNPEVKKNKHGFRQKLEWYREDVRPVMYRLKNEELQRVNNRVVNRRTRVTRSIVNNPVQQFHKEHYGDTSLERVPVLSLGETVRDHMDQVKLFTFPSTDYHDDFVATSVEYDGSVKMFHFGRTMKKHSCKQKRMKFQTMWWRLDKKPFAKTTLSGNFHRPSYPAMTALKDEELFDQHAMTPIDWISQLQRIIHRVKDRINRRRTGDDVIRDTSYFVREFFLMKAMISLRITRICDVPECFVPPTMECGYFPVSAVAVKDKVHYLICRYQEAQYEYLNLTYRSIEPKEGFVVSNITGDELYKFHKMGRHIHGFFLVWELEDVEFLDHDGTKRKQRYLVDMFNFLMFPLYIPYERWDSRLKVGFDRVSVYTLHLTEILRVNRPIFDCLSENPSLYKSITLEEMCQLMRTEQISPKYFMSSVGIHEFYDWCRTTGNAEYLSAYMVITGGTKILEENPMPPLTYPRIWDTTCAKEPIIVGCDRNLYTVHTEKPIKKFVVREEWSEGEAVHVTRARVHRSPPRKIMTRFVFDIAKSPPPVPVEPLKVDRRLYEVAFTRKKLIGVRRKIYDLPPPPRKPRSPTPPKVRKKPGRKPIPLAQKLTEKYEFMEPIVASDFDSEPDDYLSDDDDMMDVAQPKLRRTTSENSIFLDSRYQGYMLDQLSWFHQRKIEKPLLKRVDKKRRKLKKIVRKHVCRFRQMLAEQKTTSEMMECYHGKLTRTAFEVARTKHAMRNDRKYRCYNIPRVYERGEGQLVDEVCQVLKNLVTSTVAKETVNVRIKTALEGQIKQLISDQECLMLKLPATGAFELPPPYYLCLEMMLSRRMRDRNDIKRGKDQLQQYLERRVNHYESLLDTTQKYLYRRAEIDRICWEVDKVTNFELKRLRSLNNHAVNENIANQTRQHLSGDVRVPRRGKGAKKAAEAAKLAIAETKRRFEKQAARKITAARKQSALFRENMLKNYKRPKGRDVEFDYNPKSQVQQGKASRLQMEKEREEREKHRREENARLAQEQKRKEQLEKEKERAAEKQQEKERLEMLEKKRLEKEQEPIKRRRGRPRKEDQERIQREKEQAKRIRLRDEERKRREQERRDSWKRRAEQKAEQRAEEDRLRKLEEARLLKEKLEKEQREKEEAEKEKQRAEEERIEKEKEMEERRQREEAARVEKERLLRALYEREKAEREEEERKQREKENQERAQREWEEKERLRKAEEERLEKERLEKEKLEKERVEREQREKEEQERIQKEKEEQERIQKEKEEQERIQKEKEEQERIQKEKEAQERLQKEKEKQERLQKEEEERKRVQKEKEEQERRRQAEEERLKQEQLRAEQLEKENVEKENQEKERLRILNKSQQREKELAEISAQEARKNEIKCKVQKVLAINKALSKSKLPNIGETLPDDETLDLTTLSLDLDNEKYYQAKRIFKLSNLRVIASKYAKSWCQSFFRGEQLKSSQFFKYVQELVYEKETRTELDEKLAQLVKKMSTCFHYTLSSPGKRIWTFVPDDEMLLPIEHQQTESSKSVPKTSGSQPSVTKETTSPPPKPSEEPSSRDPLKPVAAVNTVAPISIEKKDQTAETTKVVAEKNVARASAQFSVVRRESKQNTTEPGEVTEDLRTYWHPITNGPLDEYWHAVSMMEDPEQQPIKPILQAGIESFIHNIPPAEQYAFASKILGMVCVLLTGEMPDPLSVSQNLKEKEMSFTEVKKEVADILETVKKASALIVNASCSPINLKDIIQFNGFPMIGQLFTEIINKLSTLACKMEIKKQFDSNVTAVCVIQELTRALSKNCASLLHEQYGNELPADFLSKWSEEQTAFTEKIAKSSYCDVPFDDPQFDIMHVWYNDLKQRNSFGYSQICEEVQEHLKSLNATEEEPELELTRPIVEKNLFEMMDQKSDISSLALFQRTSTPIKCRAPGFNLLNFEESIIARKPDNTDVIFLRQTFRTNDTTNAEAFNTSFETQLSLPEAEAPTVTTIQHSVKKRKYESALDNAKPSKMPKYEMRFEENVWKTLECTIADFCGYDRNRVNRFKASEPRHTRDKDYRFHQLVAVPLDDNREVAYGVKILTLVQKSIYYQFKVEREQTEIERTENKCLEMFVNTILTKEEFDQMKWSVRVGDKEKRAIEFFTDLEKYRDAQLFKKSRRADDTIPFNFKVFKHLWFMGGTLSEKFSSDCHEDEHPYCAGCTRGDVILVHDCTCEQFVSNEENSVIFTNATNMQVYGINRLVGRFVCRHGPSSTLQFAVSRASRKVNEDYEPNPNSYTLFPANLPVHKRKTTYIELMQTFGGSPFDITSNLDDDEIITMTKRELNAYVKAFKECDMDDSPESTYGEEDETVMNTKIKKFDGNRSYNTHESVYGSFESVRRPLTKEEQREIVMLQKRARRIRSKSQDSILDSHLRDFNVLKRSSSHMCFKEVANYAERKMNVIRNEHMTDYSVRKMETRMTDNSIGKELLNDVSLFNGLENLQPTTQQTYLESMLRSRWANKQSRNEEELENRRIALKEVQLRTGLLRFGSTTATPQTVPQINDTLEITSGSSGSIVLDEYYKYERFKQMEISKAKMVIQNLRRTWKKRETKMIVSTYEAMFHLNVCLFEHFLNLVGTHVFNVYAIYQAEVQGNVNDIVMSLNTVKQSLGVVFSALFNIKPLERQIGELSQLLESNATLDEYMSTQATISRYIIERIRIPQTYTQDISDYSAWLNSSLDFQHTINLFSFTPVSVIPSQLDRAEFDAQAKNQGFDVHQIEQLCTLLIHPTLTANEALLTGYFNQSRKLYNVLERYVPENGLDKTMMAFYRHQSFSRLQNLILRHESVITKADTSVSSEVTNAMLFSAVISHTKVERDMNFNFEFIDKMYMDLARHKAIVPLIEPSRLGTAFVCLEDALYISAIQEPDTPSFEKVKFRKTDTASSEEHSQDIFYTIQGCYFKLTYKQTNEANNQVSLIFQCDNKLDKEDRLNLGEISKLVCQKGNKWKEMLKTFIGNSLDQIKKIQTENKRYNKRVFVTPTNQHLGIGAALKQKKNKSSLEDEALRGVILWDSKTREANQPSSSRRDCF